MSKQPVVKTSVYVTKNGQFKVTIPRALAASMDLETGTKVKWKLDSGNTFRVSVVNDE